jgi:hypothetical protein
LLQVHARSEKNEEWKKARKLSSDDALPQAEYGIRSITYSNKRGAPLKAQILSSAPVNRQIPTRNLSILFL